MSYDKDFDMGNLQLLLKTMKNIDQVAVKVGILGDGAVNRRENIAKPTAKKFKAGELSAVSNCEIGMTHEFGDPSRGIPQRSFLRMPIATRFQAALDESKAFSKGSLDKVLRERSLVPWLKKIGVVAENVIDEAFDTGGFGQWKPSNMDYKKVHMTLVETQQLRRSITSEVTGVD